MTMNDAGAKNRNHQPEHTVDADQRVIPSAMKNTRKDDMASPKPRSSWSTSSSSSSSSSSPATSPVPSSLLTKTKPDGEQEDDVHKKKSLQKIEEDLFYATMNGEAFNATSTHEKLIVDGGGEDYDDYDDFDNNDGGSSSKNSTSNRSGVTVTGGDDDDGDDEQFDQTSFAGLNISSHPYKNLSQDVYGTTNESSPDDDISPVHSPRRRKPKKTKKHKESKQKSPKAKRRSTEEAAARDCDRSNSNSSNSSRDPSQDSSSEGGSSALSAEEVAQIVLERIPAKIRNTIPKEEWAKIFAEAMSSKEHADGVLGGSSSSSSNVVEGDSNEEKSSTKDDEDDVDVDVDISKNKKTTMVKSNPKVAAVTSIGMDGQIHSSMSKTVKDHDASCEDCSDTMIFGEGFYDGDESYGDDDEGMSFLEEFKEEEDDGDDCNISILSDVTDATLFRVAKNGFDAQKQTNDVIDGNNSFISDSQNGSTSSSSNTTRDASCPLMTSSSLRWKNGTAGIDTTPTSTHRGDSVSPCPLMTSSSTRWKSGSAGSDTTPETTYSGNTLQRPMLDDVTSNDKPLAMPGRHLSKVSTTKRTTKASVQFDTVRVRYYERILDINPAVTHGVAIGIGWRYKKGPKASVDEWENIRGVDRRRSKDFLLSPRDRQTLVKDLGYSQKDIAAATRIILKTKNRRKQTVHNLNAEGVEETIEGISQRVRGLLSIRRT
mmetsp:Transcript_41788/g.100281  ORF Transcript_41788/g.100281 Transcript_41788/m.100281 type:complete len:712 (+) Transcript_41788:383-2518(+)